MPVGIMGEVPITPEQYDQLNEKMNFPAEVPDGLLSHVAGPSGGGLQVVDVWESREQYDKFIESKLVPAMGEVGIEMGEPVPPTEFPIHHRYPS